MPKFRIKIDQDALLDVQEATNWHNKQIAGLGSCFQKQVKQQITSLKVNATAPVRVSRNGFY